MADQFISRAARQARRQVNAHIDTQVADLCEDLGWDRSTARRLRNRQVYVRFAASAQKMAQALRDLGVTRPRTGGLGRYNVRRYR